MSVKKIIKTIKENKTFLISTHVSPDPDALCSELALALFLKSLGKRVIIVNEEPVPKRYQFLGKSSLIESYKKNKRYPYDVLLVVDCGELDRIGKVQDLIAQNRPIINIDHHITNDRFGHLNLVIDDASSTAEVLYDLIKEAGGKLDKTIAQHLYLGIMTDTGSFRYENTTSWTFKVVSDLMRFSISPHELYQQIYERIPYADLTYVADIISRAQASFEGKVIFVSLSKKELNKFSEEFDLRDSIFKFLRAVKDVEVVIILSEVDKNKTRVNFRSNRYFDVARLSTIFGGGGHKRASGCAINLNLRRSCEELKKCIKTML